MSSRGTRGHRRTAASAASEDRTGPRNLLILAGGVGGARFLRGLARIVEPRRITVIGNTGDDEQFFGLHVAPDLDTVLYTLAGRADPVRGWGLERDTFACLDALGRLDEPTWFALGDRDLATHLFRTTRLRAGWALSRVTAALARAYGVATRIIPMTDDPVRTFVHTDGGRYAFQDYLVRRRARGNVHRIEIAGARRARPAPGVLAALAATDAIVIAPSNPLVSIGPILAVPPIRRALARRRAPAAAISPLVGGRAVRGPLHRMLRGLGLEVSPAGVARLYRGLVDVFVLDRVDAAWASRVEALGFRAVVADTLLTTPVRAARLAAAVLRALDPRRR